MSIAINGAVRGGVGAVCDGVQFELQQGTQGSTRTGRQGVSARPKAPTFDTAPWVSPAARRGKGTPMSTCDGMGAEKPASGRVWPKPPVVLSSLMEQPFEHLRPHLAYGPWHLPHSEQDAPKVSVTL